MPKGIVNGIVVDVYDKNKIGAGGEGDVYLGDGQQIPSDKVIKIYNKASRNELRAAKVNYMINLHYNPIAMHPESAFDDVRTKKTIGFVMGAVPQNFKEIRYWSNKNYRKSHKVNPAIISKGFLKLWDFNKEFHAANMVIGDYNDLNFMFEEDVDDPDMRVVDIDAAQVYDPVTGKYWPCPALTQDFCNPRLFKDVILKPEEPFIDNILFTPEDDWYSFATNYFKCLIMAHSYGGTHPTLNTIPKRAKAHVSIMDASVVYPAAIAQPLSILSDDLRDVFNEYFNNGNIVEFPRYIIEDYIDFAQTGKAFARKQYVPAVASRVETLLKGFGVIVIVSVSGSRLNVITNNNGMAMYHEIEGSGKILRQIELFKWIPSASYAFMHDLIFVSTSPEKDTVMAIDISKGKPRGAFKTTADIYSRQSRQFGTNPYALYRITSGYLMRGEVINGELLERPLFPVAVNQCRIHVDSVVDRLLGYNRLDEFMEFFLVSNGNRYEVNPHSLLANETIDQIMIRFSGRTCLILRSTLINGVPRLHIDEINAENGTLLKHRSTNDTGLLDLMFDIPFNKGILSYDEDELKYSIP